MKLIPNILSTCNCLHIALLVYLRLISVTKALKCKKIHRKHRYKSIMTLWTISIIVNVFPPLAARLDQKIQLSIFKHILLHGFHTIPIVVIVAIYAKLIYAVESKNEKDARQRRSAATCSRVNANNRLSTRMVKGVVFCLLVCYLPYLTWWQYSMVAYRFGGARWCIDFKGNNRLDVKTMEVKL